MLIALLAVLGVDLWVILVVLADAPAGEARDTRPAEVRRLGKHPCVVPLAAGGDARVEVAAAAGAQERVLGPFAEEAPRTR